LRRLRERVDRTETQLAITAGARRQAGDRALASTEALRLQERRLGRLLDRIEDADLKDERLAALERALLPGPREVFETRLLHGDETDLLVVQWHESSSITKTGIAVWSLGAEGSWDLAFVVEPRPDFTSAEDPGDVLIGPPGAAELVDSSYGVIRADVVATADATGDGAPDVVVQEMGSGSGGCGTVRLLQNMGTTLRETFHRDGCNHGIGIEDGLLVYGRAVYPKTCHNIHGCGSRRTFMRWTGSAWTVARVERPG
jgi:hypothetical protein